MRAAIMATAALTHWRHDRSGRALNTPANDFEVSPARSSGSLAPDLRNAGRGTCFNTSHDFTIA